MNLPWNEQGPVTAWTDHDGPGDLPPPPPPSLSGLLTLGWVGVFIAGTIFGCPCAADGSCPPTPLWADIAGGVFMLGLLAASVLLIVRPRWGASVSLIAAIGGAVLAVDEYTHAAWWGVLLAATMIAFAIWSVVVLKVHVRYRRGIRLALTNSRILGRADMAVEPVGERATPSSRSESAQPDRTLQS